MLTLENVIGMKKLTPIGQMVGAAAATVPGFVIVNGRPPNFDEIVVALPAAAKKGVIFTYGSTIYVTDGKPLTRALRDHEAVHVLQQNAYSGGPAAWWRRYLRDVPFRFMQELNAHQVEYATTYRQSRSRPERRHGLAQIAKRLSGPLYGHVVTLAEAKRLVQGKGVLIDKETGEEARSDLGSAAQQG